MISCDNLSENSKRLRYLLRDYLAAAFPAVLSWLDNAVTFPCSMVDRIVPAMTDALKERQAWALDCIDEGAVSTERFSQWIIEDNFAAGRPDWHTVGVQLVDEILPYENIKLRLLNASHSAIAYCGLLAGIETVDAVMYDGTLRRYVERLMDEDLVPALDEPAGFDLPAYRDELLARFSNPCLGHRCAQIAMDGSEKISQRWLPTLQVAVAPWLRRAVSAWCYFVLFTELPIDAPLADRLRGVLACARVGSETLEGFSCLVQDIERHIATLDTQGAGAVFAGPWSA